MMSKLGMEDNVPIEHSWVTKSIEQAQKKVEGHNFDIRKNLVDYDDVMNKHREVIYEERQKVLEGADIKQLILGMVEQELRELVGMMGQDEDGQDDIQGLLREVSTILPPSAELTESILASLDKDEVAEHLVQVANDQYDVREAHNGPEGMRILERFVMLQTIDRLWVEHLTAMDEMREGIGLQAYGQVDPLVAYKREAFDMFDQLMENIRNSVARGIYHIEFAPSAVAVPVAPNPAALRENRDAIENATATTGGGATVTSPDGIARPLPAAAGARPAAGAAGGVAVLQKVGRNDPCPCGSGKKYKRCHGV
jgi:preprotein translocase subunit SecA